MTVSASPPAPLSPPERLLCGPGPMNVEPSVLEAMRAPMLGHLDPTFHELMLEVVDMLHAVYGLTGGAALPLQATGMSGMETGIASLVEPGDVVIVGYAGFFGHRIAQMAARHGAQVVEVTRPWGEAVPNEALLEALERHPGARLVAVVHAETSTGVQHPVAELADEMQGSETLLVVDCVTSLGAVPVLLQRVGSRFRLLMHPKGAGRASRDVSDRVLRAGA